jgi:hypothetical protein
MATQDTNLSTFSAPFDPFQRAAVVTRPADPATVLLRRWRAADAAHTEMEARVFAAEQAYKAIAGENLNPADGGFVFADMPQADRATDPDWFEKTRSRLRDDLDEPCKKWWTGYEQACGDLDEEARRLGFLADDLAAAIINGPATPLGIAAKIELALYWLPDDPTDDYLPSILLAAKADAERLAGRARE